VRWVERGVVLRGLSHAPLEVRCCVCAVAVVVLVLEDRTLPMILAGEAGRRANGLATFCELIDLRLGSCTSVDFAEAFLLATLTELGKEAITINAWVCRSKLPCCHR
jgi:hypothetical protein